MDPMTTILICCGLSILCMIWGFSIGDIGFSDCLSLGITAGVFCGRHLGIHPAICIVIGLFVTVLLGMLQGNRILYWIIGVFVGACNSLLIGVFIYAFANEDPIWFAVSSGLVLLAIIGMHLSGRGTESAGKFNVPLIIVNTVIHSSEKEGHDHPDEQKPVT